MAKNYGVFSAITNLWRPKKAKSIPVRTRSLAGLSSIEEIMGGGGGAAGATKAMRVSVVYACVNRKAKDVATLPLRPMRKLESGQEIARDHDQYFISKNPSPLYTNFNWLFTLNAHIDLHGEAFAPIIRKSGRPVRYGIWNAARIKHVLVSDHLYWEYTPEDGSPKQMWPDDDMLHVFEYSKDGIRGESPLSYARDAINLASNSSKLSSNLYKNQMWSPGYISYKGDLTEEQAKLLSEYWKVNLSGEANADEIGVLDNGGEWKQFGMSLKDSEYLGTANLSRLDLCMFYGVQPSLIGLRDGSNVSYNSLEQDNISYVQNTLQPRCEAWEEELNRKVISDEDQDQIAFKFELKGRLRGDMLTRKAFYVDMRNAGVFSANDILRLEDMQTIGPEGDLRLVNSASIPLESLLNFEKEVKEIPDAEKLFREWVKIKSNGHDTAKV